MGKGKARVRYKLSLNESNENLANARWELLKISQTGSLNTAQTEKGSSADFELSENQNYVLRITPKTGASPMEYDARTASNIITTLTPRAGSYRK